MINTRGYDDVYFADDSEKNVKAVRKMLRGKDVKWRVQLIKEDMNPTKRLKNILLEATPSYFKHVKVLGHSIGRH